MHNEPMKTQKHNNLGTTPTNATTNNANTHETTHKNKTNNKTQTTNE